MKVHSIRDLLAAHPLFGAFDAASLDLIAGCGRLEHFAKGITIFREGDTADRIYILRHGDVATEIDTPGRDPLIVETLHGGDSDLLGWGWLVPPYRRMADARAVSEVSAIALDAGCVRGKCDEHPELGYAMFKLWLPRLTERMRAQRLQLLDLYGGHGI